MLLFAAAFCSIFMFGALRHFKHIAGFIYIVSRSHVFTHEDTPWQSLYDTVA